MWFIEPCEIVVDMNARAIQAKTGRRRSSHPQARLLGHILCRSLLSRQLHEAEVARTVLTSRAGGDKAVVEIRLAAFCINSLRRPSLVSSNSYCHAVSTVEV